jgi:hypothetical protein
MPLCEAVLYEEHTTSRKPLPGHCKMGFRNANMMLVFTDGSDDSCYRLLRLKVILVIKG